MSWTHSDFLDVSPDVEVDHRYLTDAEIAALPPGVYYKKKDRITPTASFLKHLCVPHF